MQEHNPYPTPEDRNATRYYHMLFKDQDPLAAIYLICTAAQKGKRLVEVLETYTDFLSRRHEISETDFYRTYTKENGDLLRVVATFSDLAKA